MATTPKKKYPPVPPGKRLIFRPYYVDPRTGKRVYPRNGRVFAFYVDA